MVIVIWYNCTFGVVIVKILYNFNVKFLDYIFLYCSKTYRLALSGIIEPLLPQQLEDLLLVVVQDGLVEEMGHVFHRGVVPGEGGGVLGIPELVRQSGVRRV